MAKKARSKAVKAAFCSDAPALIDPPFAESVDDWLAFRTSMVELQASGMPDVIRGVEQEIARLRKGKN